VAFELSAEPREGAGRAPSRRLRRAGRVPAIVYGGGEQPSAISLDHNKLVHQMDHEAFYTSILTLKVGKQDQAVVVKAVHRHPAKPEILHLDFQRIVADEEITLHVPIHFVGETAAVGVKEQGGVIEHLLTDVEITCLPKNLPEFLELDVSKLELNGILHLSDIPLPEGVTSTSLEHGLDNPVVAINPPRREEVEEAEEGEAAAPEAPEAQAKGETPDEDAAD
jgi:large subunit ribosomal protein L25